jgi:hypothetical protein
MEHMISSITKQRGWPEPGAGAEFDEPCKNGCKKGNAIENSGDDRAFDLDSGSSRQCGRAIMKQLSRKHQYLGDFLPLLWFTICPYAKQPGDPPQVSILGRKSRR